ncbi:MAG: hypothetical protein IJT27_04690 [Clostridia bacterium]|nr:hypothetical protein [Clostridia bacterium]MBQ7688497.1 hypothetical protein [Clostridia bacterium]
MEETVMHCLRCGKKMLFLKKEDIQLGKQSLLHNWNHILHGTLDVEIYVCPRCGKLEFYMPSSVLLEADLSEQPARPNEIIGFRCDSCGRMVPKDNKFCPGCGESGAALLPQVRCPECGCIHDFDDPKCPSCHNP